VTARERPSPIVASSAVAKDRSLTIFIIEERLSGENSPAEDVVTSPGLSP
jgi:hypothetical protein